MTSRRSAAVLLGTLMVGVAGCGGGPADPAGEPVTTSPAAAAGVEPPALEQFLGNDLRFTSDGDFGLDISELYQDRSGNGLLRTFYPEGSASRGMGGPGGGLQAYLRLSRPADVIDLSYLVHVPAGFDFVKGGKLPGLYGGSVHSGKKIPDGSNGFSTRYMWRAGGDGEVYAYLPSSQTHGTSLGRGCWRLTPGKWAALRQRVQLNSPGAQDGRISVWQDGQLAYDRGRLDFRSTDQLKIDGVFFSTFFGGDDQSWVSPTDQYLDFARFEIVEDSAPPSETAPASNDDSSCGIPGAS